MKLTSFRAHGRDSWGAVVGDKIIDLAKRTPFASLRAALAAGSLPMISEIRTDQSDYALGGVELLPVIPDPAKILCIGTNYHDHRIETGREVPEKPVVFSRFANSQVGHGQPLIRPMASEQFDFEGEIAVVIGKPCRRVPEDHAWTVIAGYAPYNDGTVRDWQRHTHQWIPGKNFPKTGAFGPWMVTRDEIPDGADLTLVTRLNGQVVQSSSSDLMIFSIPALIAYCSTFTDLEPGDVIVTGTPGGVGAKRTPPLWLKQGDLVEVEVGRVGTLSSLVIDETA